MLASAAVALAAELAARCGAAPVHDPAISALLEGPALTDAAAAARAVLRGTWDPWPEVLVAAGPGARDRIAAEAPCGATHFGLAEERQRAAAVFVQRRAARFSREVKDGKLRIEGELQAGLFAPRLYATPPAGRPRHLPLRSVGERGFAGDFALAPAGRWLVEVMADGPAGPVVAALGELFTDGPAPPSPPAAPPEADPQDPEGELVRRVNLLRETHGLAKLVRDPALDAAARAHAEDMAKERRAAHVLPGNRTVAGRLEAADYPYAVERENVGEADTAMAAHAAVFKSPAHHLNLLTDDVDRIGVGLARADGRVYLAEVLARRRTIPGNADEMVLAQVQNERKRRGLKALERREDMDALALQAVRDAAARDGHPDGLAEQAVKTLPGLRGVAVQSLVASSPEAAAEKIETTAEMAYVGIGAVVASTPKRGRDKLWLIVLLGEK